jgi:endonuclease/exonuclease/phosphatase family metal-dependent hydrolase
MAGRRLAAFAACLLCAAAFLTGSHPAGRVVGEEIRVIQMNLCNSGIASCYTGRAVAEAAAVIRAEAPDLVTLNEVCQNDVPFLDDVLAEVQSGGTVVSAFKAADDRSTGDAFRCLNGQPYGIGLLRHLPPINRGYTTSSRIYQVQDTGDPEERAWLCVYATGSFTACTTHLASTSATVALAQCRQLFSTVIPAGRTVLGGDFNLDSAGLQACVPSGLRLADGGTQQIVATAEFTVVSSKTIDMHGTTNHPSLSATLTAPLRRTE